MDETRLAAEGERIAAANAARRGAPLVLRGIEMDLTPEGVGDMDPAALAALDLVLGAFHSKLRLRDDQTERYLCALANPDVHVLAHPRGRIYNFRSGLACDWERVARRAAETGTALEIDAYPDRQDLDVERLRVADQAGAWISIGTDAHTPDELVYLDIGIAARCRARRDSRGHQSRPRPELSIERRARGADWCSSCKTARGHHRAEGMKDRGR